MKIIDKNSRIPIYVQLMDILTEQLENSDFGDEGKLPSERELCAAYQLSRSTVRQAIQELERDGYVSVRRGKGVYALPKRFNQEMSGLYSFTAEMEKLGKVVSSKLIDYSVISCDERIARKMQCASGKDIIRFTRVRYVDNIPLIVVTTHLLCERFPGFSANPLVTGSLYAMLHEKYNVSFTKVKENFQSVSARKDEAELLQVEFKAPCMKIVRRSFEHDTLFEYAVGIARGDKYQYDIELC